MTARTLASHHSPIARDGLLVSMAGAVRRHPVATYVVLAWGISWAYWLAMLVRGDIVTPGGSVSHFPGLFGPLIAAFGVTALVSGRAGISDLIARMFRWRVGVRWYAMAALPFVLFLAGVAVLAAIGGRTPALDDLASYSGLPRLGLPAVVVLAFLANGFGEEVGWRGFAQPHLETRRSFLQASVLVAVVWATWHVPSFALIDGYRQMGLGVIPVFVLGLGSGAIVLGWLYDRSGGSILMAALFHLGLNMGSATLAGRGLPAALVTAGIIVWAIVIVVSELRRGRQAPAPAGASQTARRRSRWAAIGDASIRLLLGSPLHPLVGRGMLLLTFRGRTSGRRYTTPVEYVRDGDRLLVLVAQPARKQWWRNVRADPRVGVHVSGHERAAVATVEVGMAEADADLSRYLAARPRAARIVSGSPAETVVVALTLEAEDSHQEVG